MTKVERILNRVKNHPAIGIFIVIGIGIISLAQFTDALQRLHSFFIGSKKPQSIQHIARFPFDLQVSRAKERIRYLSQEYLKTNTMSLVEVVGAYGDNVLDSPQFYDWNKVMNELERQGYINILRRTENNIEFRVLGR